jgi:hypothetical protein
LRTKLAQVAWKRNLAKKLIDIVSKLDYEVLKQASISEKIKIETLRYIPHDGKWHHFAQSVECWIKDGSKKTKKQTFVDGVKARRIKK